MSACPKCKRQQAGSVAELEPNHCKAHLRHVVTVFRGSVLRVDCFRAAHHLRARAMGFDRYVDTAELVINAPDSPIHVSVVIVPRGPSRVPSELFDVTLFVYFGAKEWQDHHAFHVGTNPTELMIFVQNSIAHFMATALVEEWIRFAN